MWAKLFIFHFFTSWLGLQLVLTSQSLWLLLPRSSKPASLYFSAGYTICSFKLSFYLWLKCFNSLIMWKSKILYCNQYIVQQKKNYKLWVAHTYVYHFYKSLTVIWHKYSNNKIKHYSTLSFYFLNTTLT